MEPLYTEEEFEAAKSRQLLPLRCQTCGVTFHRSKNEIKSGTRRCKDGMGYCSRQCQGKSMVTSETVACTVCGKSIVRVKSALKAGPPYFCSHSCSAQVSNRRCKRKPVSERTCPTCGKVFSLRIPPSREKDTFYCSRECFCGGQKKRALASTKTLGEIINAKGQPSNRYASVRDHCHCLHKKLTKTSCANCGYAKHVELCHIKAVRDFPLDTPLIVINSSENVIQLCPNCHWEFDHGELKLGGR